MLLRENRLSIFFFVKFFISTLLGIHISNYSHCISEPIVCNGILSWQAWVNDEQSATEINQRVYNFNWVATCGMHHSLHPSSQYSKTCAGNLRSPFFFLSWSSLSQIHFHWIPYIILFCFLTYVPTKEKERFPCLCSLCHPTPVLSFCFYLEVWDKEFIVAGQVGFGCHCVHPLPGLQIYFISWCGN